jgi:hypothetical protein
MDIGDAFPLDLVRILSECAGHSIPGIRRSQNMNIDHLRKQAKNLQSIFPELVAAGPKLSLASAQAAIARTHGFPSWSAAVAKAALKTSESATPYSSIGAVIRKGYVFVAEEETQLPIELDDNAEPSRYAPGREVVLRFRQKREAAKVARVDQIVDELADYLGNMTGDYTELTPEELSLLLAAARNAVAKCPLYVDGWNRIAGSLLTQGKYDEAMAIAEPVTLALLDLLPKQGLIQVCYGMLVNRPFYRVVHCYLLLLDKARRHREADALAQRMYSLWPNDNMGFRFLLTREDRAGELKRARRSL